MAFAEEMTVKTEKGTVRGIRVDHDFGQYYYSFRGIRYAQAPTGKLRFKVCMYIIFLGNNAPRFGYFDFRQKILKHSSLDAILSKILCKIQI